MWKYSKKLQFPVNIRNKNLKMAKSIISQYGGAQGELSAALRYLNQRYTMPDERGRTLLTDIGTEEFSHVEMICTLVYQLTRGASVKEFEEGDMGEAFATHGTEMFMTDSALQDFSVTGIGATGDFLADLEEDKAAEEKARTVYEHLLDLAHDEEVIQPLLYLRQREIVHYHRFSDLQNLYKKEFNK